MEEGTYSWRRLSHSGLNEVEGCRNSASRESLSSLAVGRGRLRGRTVCRKASMGSSPEGALGDSWSADIAASSGDDMVGGACAGWRCWGVLGEVEVGGSYVNNEAVVMPLPAAMRRGDFFLVI